MNTPNKLTIVRFFLAPLFFLVYQLMLNFNNTLLYLSLLTALWLAIELTDLLDGIIARKYKLVTDLGKVMDPFADVFARLTYFVCFTYSGLMPVWAFLIIMYREFSIVFLRLLMMRTGKAVPANIFGKGKAVLYAISAILTIIYFWIAYAGLFDSSVMRTLMTVLRITYIASAIAAIASFVVYAKDIIKTKALSGITR